MSKIVLFVAVFSTAAFVIGCEKPKPAPTPAPTDLEAAPTVTTPPSSTMPPMTAEPRTNVMDAPPKSANGGGRSLESLGTPGAAASAGDGFVVHTVQKGDTLWSLAKQYLGDGKRYKEIVDANPGLTPEKLAAGMQIHIPTK